ncbi:putative membrane protein YeaQ/YmgE (transglycosylase-associated protein family) [Pseudomonas sp. TE3610]
MSPLIAGSQSATRLWLMQSIRGFNMGIIGTIFIGLIVGLLARFLKPGDDSMGWIMTILLGIGGSLAATYGGQALGIYQAGQGAGFLGALIGAIILLVLYGMIKKND